MNKFECREKLGEKSLKKKLTGKIPQKKKQGEFQDFPGSFKQILQCLSVLVTL